MNNMKNLLIIMSGPSGVGKGTIMQILLQKGGYALSVSCTTRERRSGEVEGKSYFFVSDGEFKKMIEEGGFLEYNNHFEHSYGTPKKFVEEKLKTQNVILEIEVDGALKVKEKYPEAFLIMVLPPDRETLRQRLIKRKTESAEQIEERLERYDYELSKRDKYDFVVINDDLNIAVEKIEKAIKARKSGQRSIYD